MNKRAYVDNEIARLFEGRKGHGGYPARKRTLNKTALSLIILAAYDAGSRDGATVRATIREMKREEFICTRCQLRQDAKKKPGEPPF